MDQSQKNPKALISYSHDSTDHKERVLAFCDRLRADGIDCVIDQFISSPEEGWPRWMINQISAADFVLIVATNEYNRRFVNGVDGSGAGVRWEGLVITQEVYNAKSRNTKFIPIVLRASDIKFIPIILQGVTSYDVSSRQGYEDLYRHITGQPRACLRTPGPIHVLPSCTPRPHSFDADALTDGASDFPSLCDSGGLVMNDEHFEVNDSGNVATAIDTELIELRIDRNFDSYTDDDQRKLLAAVGQLLGISGEVRVIQRRPGSVKILLELPSADIERLRWAIERGELDDFDVVDITQTSSIPTLDVEAEAIVAPITTEESKSVTYERIVRFAKELYDCEPDWVTFFREVLGVDGIVRRHFNRLEELSDFEKSNEFEQIQKWLVKLRENAKGDGIEAEPTHTITVRLPKSMHEFLRTEAHDLRTSMNKLCISKLLQVIKRDLIPVERNPSASQAQIVNDADTSEDVGVRSASEHPGAAANS